MKNKTELETAKELFYNYKEEYNYSKRKMNFGECFGHFQTCKRWLEFLNELFKDGGLKDFSINKIKDLDETIKFYEEKGIQ